MAKKRKKKKTSAPAQEQLQPPKGGLAIRMYCHGLGDCFLLAFDKSNSDEPCYVLIDCGVHMRQDKGSARLGEVMTNLVAATGGKLTVVVATHEHADHLSGFVQKGSPFINGALKVNNFWVAWTENFEDRQANKLRRKRGAARDAIRKAAEKIRQRGVAASAGRLTGLLDFENFDADGVAAAAKAKAKERASYNEAAIEILRQMASVNYCEPGQTLELPGVRGARAYVLGPPRDEDLLKRDKPAEGAGRETYLTGRARQRTFIQAPVFCPSPDPREADMRHPFENNLRRKCRFELRSATARWRGEGSPPKETRLFCDDHYFTAAADWRRVDTDWLDTAEQLALDLNNDTNNTSLSIAFELGPARRGQVFLFTGDAQVGNWLSWRSQEYKAGSRTSSADDLLARTVLYKVAHHGSHNATVRRDPLDKSADYPQGEPFGLELMPSKLTALIPVDRAAVRKRMPTPWHMPHPPLYRRLLEKTGGRVLRSDGLSPRSEGISASSQSPGDSKAMPVSGLTNTKWRKSRAKFVNGRKCPLYYDLIFER